MKLCNLKRSNSRKSHPFPTKVHISWLCLGNSSVVKIYIIRPKQGPVAKNATPRLAVEQPLVQ